MSVPAMALPLASPDTSSPHLWDGVSCYLDWRDQFLAVDHGMTDAIVWLNERSG